jgi:hypothetical protein
VKSRARTLGFYSCASFARCEDRREGCFSARAFGDHSYVTERESILCSFSSSGFSVRGRWGRNYFLFQNLFFFFFWVCVFLFVFGREKLMRERDSSRISYYYYYHLKKPKTNLFFHSLSLAIKNRITSRVNTSALKSRSVSRQSARASFVVKAQRDVWWPGVDAPAHLDGSLPGDFGFDPLGLSVDPEMKKWMVQAELQHARWAMLGVAGMVGPDLAPWDTPSWIDAGKFEYWAPAGPLFFIQMAMMNWAEVRRWQDMKEPGSMNKDPLFGYNADDTNTDVGYPGGLFDKLGYAKKDLDTLKLKEIKNGRLAMVAIAGCFVQGATTGVSPLTNLTAHIANPGAVNIFN